MSILNTHATNYAWSNRLLDTTYNGPCVNVRRSDGDPLTDPTQDINYVDGVIDMSALNTFLGTSAGYVTIAYNPQGVNDWVMTDASRQPRIDVATNSDGLAYLTFTYGGSSGLEIDDTHNYSVYSFYFAGQFFGADATTDQSRDFRLIGPANESINRSEVRVKTSESVGGGGIDSFSLSVSGTSTDTADYFMNSFGEDEAQDKIISALVDQSLGTASLYYNQSALTENEAFSSAGGTGVDMIRFMAFEAPPIHISSFLYYPDEQHTEATRTEIETFLRNAPISIGPITKDGVVQSGVVVQVTAYDDYTMATGKQDVGIYVTDANGVASIPITDMHAGKKIFIAPHLNDAGTTSSAQGKFVSDVF